MNIINSKNAFKKYKKLLDRRGYYLWQLSIPNCKQEEYLYKKYKANKKRKHIISLLNNIDKKLDKVFCYCGSCEGFTKLSNVINYECIYITDEGTIHSYECNLCDDGYLTIGLYNPPDPDHF